MDEYRPQWFVYPKNRICHNIPGGQTECSKTERGINAMKLPVSGVCDRKPGQCRL